MRVLDLFSGIGGFSLGLERAGFETVAFCEADPFARAVLRRHWPVVPCYDDVRTLTERRLREDGVARPDVVCGGFPCQDISAAGKGAGLDGLRSSLWRDLLRLVAECRPTWAVVENVPALRLRGSDRITGALEAAGYACWPLVVGAVHAGAPHRRQRVFIVARDTRGGGLADTQGAGLESGVDQSTGTAPGLSTQRCRGWLPEPGLGRVVDGLSARLDRRARLTALGNAVVPDVAMALGEAILAAEAVQRDWSAQAAAERTRSAKDLRNFATFGATTARQYPA